WIVNQFLTIWHSGGAHLSEVKPNLKQPKCTILTWIGLNGSNSFFILQMSPLLLVLIVMSGVHMENCQKRLIEMEDLQMRSLKIYTVNPNASKFAVKGEQ